MQILVKSKGFPLEENEKEFVIERVRFSLTRYASRIAQVLIVLDDINGPKGGFDKRCRINLKLDNQPTIVVQETLTSVQDAVNSSLARLKRTVARNIDKHNQNRVSKVY